MITTFRDPEIAVPNERDSSILHEFRKFTRFQSARRETKMKWNETNLKDVFIFYEGEKDECLLFSGLSGILDLNKKLDIFLFYSH